VANAILQPHIASELVLVYTSSNSLGKKMSESAASRHGSGPTESHPPQFLERFARRRRASFCCCGVSFGGRPMCCPRAFARLRPSAVRVRIKSLRVKGLPVRTDAGIAKGAVLQFASGHMLREA
jgi:hypothetical protein